MPESLLAVLLADIVDRRQDVLRPGYRLKASRGLATRGCRARVRSLVRRCGRGWFGISRLIVEGDVSDEVVGRYLGV